MGYPQVHGLKLYCRAYLNKYVEDILERSKKTSKMIISKILRKKP